MTNVEAFRTFVDDARPCWRHYAPAAALTLVGIDPRGDEPFEPVLVQRAPSAGSGEVDVTLVFEHEGDDSVAATNYRFTFVDEAFVGGTAGCSGCSRGCASSAASPAEARPTGARTSACDPVQQPMVKSIHALCGKVRRSACAARGWQCG